LNELIRKLEKKIPKDKNKIDRLNSAINMLKEKLSERTYLHHTADDVMAGEVSDPVQPIPATGGSVPNVCVNETCSVTCFVT
jgi:hypothetical protein